MDDKKIIALLKEKYRESLMNEAVDYGLPQKPRQLVMVDKPLLLKPRVYHVVPFMPD